MRRTSTPAGNEPGKPREQRADRWLRSRFPALSRAQIVEALETGLVTGPGGRRLKKGDAVTPGDPPDCSRLVRHMESLALGNPRLTIPVLYESEDIVAVDKPAGMPGHPVHLRDTDTVVHWALARYPEIRGWARQCQPTVTPHRLDSGTSGVLLVARREQAYRNWRRRFGRGRVEKEYLAWCWGKPAAEGFTIEQAICHDAADARRMTACRPGMPGRGRPRPAETHIRVMQQYADRFLCRAVTRSGVTHQVRVHLAFAGFPLIGDVLYDADAPHRPECPAHFLLRASRLRGGDLDISVPVEAFTALYRE